MSRLQNGIKGALVGGGAGLAFALLATAVVSGVFLVIGLVGGFGPGGVDGGTVVQGLTVAMLVVFFGSFIGAAVGVPVGLVFGALLGLTRTERFAPWIGTVIAVLAVALLAFSESTDGLILAVVLFIPAGPLGYVAGLLYLRGMTGWQRTPGAGGRNRITSAGPNCGGDVARRPVPAG
ncbi:MAG: hypothetical protein AAGD35_03780 [Actinomycetota bacterium]